MTQYNTLNVKQSNSQLKIWIKNNTEVTLKISSKAVGDSNDKSNFPHKLLLTHAQVSRLCKALANSSSANIKLSKTKLHKIWKSGRFLGRDLGPLLKPGLPLIENVLKPSAKTVLITLGLTAAVAAAAAATDGAIHKKTLGSGMTTLIISYEEMNDIMKMITSFEKSGLLITGR